MARGQSEEQVCSFSWNRDWNCAPMLESHYDNSSVTQYNIIRKLMLKITALFQVLQDAEARRNQRRRGFLVLNMWEGKGDQEPGGDAETSDHRASWARQRGVGKKGSCPDRAAGYQLRRTPGPPSTVWWSPPCSSQGSLGPQEEDSLESLPGALGWVVCGRSSQQSSWNWPSLLFFKLFYFFLFYWIYAAESRYEWCSCHGHHSLSPLWYHTDLFPRTGAGAAPTPWGP